MVGQIGKAFDSHCWAEVEISANEISAYANDVNVFLVKLQNYGYQQDVYYRQNKNGGITFNTLSDVRFVVEKIKSLYCYSLNK